LTHIKRHIAAVLAGLLVFPIIFQSVHTVRHHSLDRSASEGDVCCTGNEPDPCSDGSCLSNSTGDCPICEYQFTVNGLPDFTIHEAIIPAVTGFYHDVATAKPYLQPVALNSTRAPPFLAFS